MIAMITRLTEGIYIDVSSNTAEPAQPALILSEDHRYQDIYLFLDGRGCSLYYQYSQP